VMPWRSRRALWNSLYRCNPCGRPDSVDKGPTSAAAVLGRQGIRVQVGDPGEIEQCHRV
jgi:hypothetical protein